MLEGKVIFESYDKTTGMMKSRKELLCLDIEKPKTVDGIGIDYKSQVNLVKETIDQFIKLQSPLINEYKQCPKCKSKVSKRGKSSCTLHSMNSDHEFEIQKYRCPHCDWTSSDSIKKMYGTDVHTSLTKLQAELGGSYSFRKTVSTLQLLSLDKKRPVNNKERIKRVVTKVGNAIEEYHKISPQESDKIPSVSSLIVHVDGAHVRTKEKNKRSFEAMTGTIFKPEDIKIINDKRSFIQNKTCVASARNDKQKTMKEMLVNAAKKSGMTRETEITALSDGASNCKNVISSLSPHCGKLTVILDWFHIGMKFQNVLQILSEKQQKELESAKWKLWHGSADDCFAKLTDLIDTLEDTKSKKRTKKLLSYLKPNKDILVDYGLRKKNKQPLSSNVAESTVENLVNSRYRQTGKMQWGREGAHSLLQVKAAIYSNSLNKMWDFVLSKILPLSA